MNLLLSFHRALIQMLPSLLLDRLSRTLSRTGPTTGITLFVEKTALGVTDWEVLSSPDGPPQRIPQTHTHIAYIKLLLRISLFQTYVCINFVSVLK